MQIALVSRELVPFGGSGIGEYVDTAARLLTQLGEVTILTTERHRLRYEALVEAGDPGGLLVPAVRYAFVPEADEPGSFYSTLHRYSAGVLDLIAKLYPDGGPDLLEFSDYLGEGFVATQARATRDPRLARTLVAIRLHTTAEICAVLDGHVDPNEFVSRSITEMERYAIRHADAIIWPGGDVLGLYERFYGADRLAPAVRIRNPLAQRPETTTEEQPDEGPVRMLYMGRLERRKGVENLLHAVSAMQSDWRLTVLGRDTDTAPLAGSMREQLELIASGDPRVTFLDEVPRAELPGVIAVHDIVVLPSLWENWPYVALEAMRMNRPVVATPTGGFTELVQPDVNGWLTEDLTSEGLTRLLDRLCHAPELARAPALAGGPRRTVADLVDATEIVQGYSDLLDRRPEATVGRRARPVSGRPLVSVIVPYFRMAEFVEETIASLLAQSYRPLEIIVVNDGSFGPDDRKLIEIANRYPLRVVSQPNSGLGAARNLGIGQSRGRYVLPLDADDLIEPSFAARCVEVLEAERDIAFVTTWSRYVDEHGEPLGGELVGYQPIGNESEMVHRDNVAGTAVSVIRRRVFDLGFAYSEDLTSYEDWQLYRELHDAGLEGRVIPERLLRYRVRTDSMIRAVGFQHTQRLWGEMQARTREREVAWASSSA